MTPRRVLYGLAVAAALVAGSWAVLALLLPAAWLVCAYFWPFAPCWSCRGRKTNRGSSRRRYGSCRVCKGSGSRQVLGSKSLHRAVRSASKYRNERKEK
jgi:hypothetical protein